MLRSLTQISKAQPGTVGRETIQRRIEKPEIPQKGEIGNITRQLAEEPLERKVPIGSEKVIAATPIPETASQLGGQPASALGPQVVSKGTTLVAQPMLAGGNHPRPATAVIGGHAPGAGVALGEQQLGLPEGLELRTPMGERITKIGQAANVPDVGMFYRGQNIGAEPEMRSINIRDTAKRALAGIPGATTQLKTTPVGGEIITKPSAPNIGGGHVFLGTGIGGQTLLRSLINQLSKGVTGIGSRLFSSLIPEAEAAVPGIIRQGAGIGLRSLSLPLSIGAGIIGSEIGRQRAGQEYLRAMTSKQPIYTGPTVLRSAPKVSPVQQGINDIVGRTKYYANQATNFLRSLFGNETLVSVDRNRTFDKIGL